MLISNISRKSLCISFLVLIDLIVTNGAKLPTIDIQGSLQKDSSTSRQPKFLFGSTTTSTTTLSTSTLCYSLDNAAATCDRKKRSTHVSDEPIHGSESTPDFILPTTSKVLTEEEESEQYIIDTLKSQKEFEGMNLNQIKSIANAGRQGRNNGEVLPAAADKADGRFIFYFYTSTVIKTSTSYTKSFTLTITQCTPPAGLTIPVGQCG